MNPLFVLDTVSDFSRPRVARRALWTMLRRVCHAAAAAHLGFLLLFASLGLSMLVWTNVASIALFLCSGALLTRRRNGIALSLIVGEVVVHAVIASLLLGWDSGFHYYLLTIIGPLAVGMNGTTLSKLARLLAFGALYGALDAWTRQVPPVYPLEPVLLDAVRFANIAGMLAIMAFVSLTYARQIAAAEGALQTLASTDSLTGLHNRRHFLEMVQSVRSQGSYTTSLCVLLCDIDHFKEVNDRHGHETGDWVLQKVAGAITGAVRPTDRVARWGGEEFIVLMSGVDLIDAAQTAERIRCAVEALQLDPPHLTSPAPPTEERQLSIPVTITIGVSSVAPEDAIDVAIARADDALYQGKDAGRNRVIAHGDEQSIHPIG